MERVCGACFLIRSSSITNKKAQYLIHTRLMKRVFLAAKKENNQ